MTSTAEFRTRLKRRPAHRDETRSLLWAKAAAAFVLNSVAEGFAGAGVRLERERRFCSRTFASSDDDDAFNEDPWPKSVYTKSIIGDHNNFDAALCIVPPQEVWDTLQRARHMARDPAFRTWPPAIRLFHPFIFDDNRPEYDPALELATIVEDLGLEPFEVTMDQWTIIPHVELIQEQWERSQQYLDGLAEDHFRDYEDDYVGSSTIFDEWQVEEDRKSKELIQRIEEEGRRKQAASLKRRAEKAREKRELLKGRSTDDGEPKKPPKGAQDDKSRLKKSPQQLLREQQQQFNEFDGPCIICLEPDEESKDRLIDVRGALQELLQYNPYSSPSSIYSWKFGNMNPDEYRPLIPISACASVSSAVEITRKLKSLWNPLTFTVEDLHMISCVAPKHSNDESYEDDLDEDLFPFGLPNIAMEDSIVPDATLRSKMHLPWGCNARVKLVGCELEQDEEENARMARKLYEEGEYGGAERDENSTFSFDVEDSNTSDIENWLNDDGFDAGSTVIIGRTHYYTGDQRFYGGMPASSHVDAKDLSQGDNGVSGAARRRGNIHRNGATWNDGEYGHRSTDYSPFTKFDRRNRETAIPRDDLLDFKRDD